MKDNLFELLETYGFGNEKEYIYGKLERIYQIEKNLIRINDIKEFWLFLNSWFSIREISNIFSISERTIYRISDYIRKLNYNDLVFASKNIKRIEILRKIFNWYFNNEQV